MGGANSHMSHRICIAFLFTFTTALLGSTVALGADPAAIRQTLNTARTPAQLNAADPYKAYRYKFRWHGGTALVAGASRFAATARTPTGHAGDSAAPYKSGVRRTTGVFTDVVVERGRSYDAAFTRWAAALAAPVPADITVDLVDEAGRVASTQRHAGCVPTEAQLLPELDGYANAMNIEHLRLHCVD